MEYEIKVLPYVPSRIIQILLKKSERFCCAGLEKIRKVSATSENEYSMNMLQ